MAYVLMANRIGKPKVYICVECGISFIAPNHNHRKYCLNCSVLVARRLKHPPTNLPKRPHWTPEYRRQKAREWRQSPEGKQYFVEYHLEYMKNPENRTVKVITTKRYQQTPKGKGAMARVKARRRARSTDPAIYGSRVELLHLLRENCNLCGKEYEATHEIDHIIPLFRGGIDSFENLRPLCYQCHRHKSGEELKGRRI